ncbi:MAG: alpha/beta hydrolase [Acidimicrobiales bacterium]
MGDKSSAQPEGVALARAGFVAFAPDYRLDAPDPWPAELRDVQTALRWVQDNAATYGVDPQRIGAFGGSAGGNLAMLLGTNGPGAAGRPPIRAVVSWSGPSDLISLAPTNVGGGRLGTPGSVRGANTPQGCVDDPNCVGVIDPSVIQAYIGCTLTQCPADYRAASPVFHVGAQTPPMCSLRLLRRGLSCCSRRPRRWPTGLTRSGVAAQVLAVPGDRHADAYRDVATVPMVQFFTTYLADGASSRIAPGTPTTTWLPPSAIGALPESAGFRARALQVAAIVLAAVAAVGLGVAVVSRRRRWHPDLHRR